MSSFSGPELFEKATAGDDDADGVLQTDNSSPVQPSSTANGEANIGASQTDYPSPVRPTSTADGDGNTRAAQAGSTSPVRPSSTANGDATTGAAQADSAFGVRPSSSTANGGGTTGALRTDSASPVQPSSTVNGDGAIGKSRVDSASRVRPSAGSGDGVGGVLRVGLVDEVGLSDEGLRSRLKVLGRAESTLAAMKARALAELSRRHNKRDAQRLIRDELQTSKRDAKRDVETATRLAELPATSGALNSGDIPVSHAQLIARAAGESPINETLLVEAANNEPFDEFMQTVKLHQRDVAADDGQSLLDRQRKKRKARIFESSDSGMFVLTGEFDQITGARIATALTAKERQLWHREDPNNRATPQQRMADALAELISEPTGDSRSVGTDLLVIADFDVLEQQLENPRLVDGSPIPTGELHKMALEANLLPSIFDTKTQDMWLGRRVRTATEAQRIALIARDQHCIGCGANPLWCQAHHIIWWSKNGPTDLDNLVLVCDDCHHKIHDDGWQVHKHPKTGKYQLKPPTQPTNERPAAPWSEPSTHPTDKRPTGLSDKSAITSSRGLSSSGPGDFLDVSVGGPSTHPADKHPTISMGEPSTHPADKHPTVLSDKPASTSLGETSTRRPGEYPTGLSDGSSTRPSGERSAVSSDEVSTISTSRPDRARTREDPDQPESSGATQSTIENERGLANSTHAQQEKQTRSDTLHPRPAARTTGHDPIDSIDTS